MKVSYDRQHDILDISEGPSVDGSSIEHDPGVAVHFGTDGGRDIVAATVMGASSWFKKGYDESSDTWLFGDTDQEHSRVTTDGDFLGYWPLVDEDKDFPVPIGFALRNASKHLASVRHHLEKTVQPTKQPQS